MKHTRLFAKLIATVAVATIILSSGLLLFACNRTKTYTLDDIFQATSSEAEFSGYVQELTLPIGWEVYTPTVTTKLGSDTGYIKSLNAFIIAKYVDPTATTKVVQALSLIKCGDNRDYGGGAPGMVFPAEIGIIAMRIKGNLIVCKFSNGDIGAFDVNGRTSISRGKVSLGDSDKTISDTSLDNVIKILDDSLIAVHANYDEKGTSGFTSIYRPTYEGDVGQRGELVCRVKNNDNALSYVNGFDGKYVSVVGNKTGDCIYRIPDRANGGPVSMTAGDKATLVDEGQENYDSEMTYIGGGRFFLYETWTVSKSDDYMYTDGSKYWVFSRYIYTPDNDSLTEYTKNSDKVFLNISNQYYDSTKTGIDTKAYLNDGFMYASYGLFIIDKVAYYDQYILDSDLDVAMSLTGNLGVTIKGQTKDKVGVFDLIMTKTDDYYYIPLAPSEINIYDAKGNRVGHNDRTTVLQQELSNNVIVAGITDPDDEDDVLYGAFNIKGEEIIEFKYTSLSAFRGSYSIGEYYVEGNKTYALIGEDGREITEMSDGTKPFDDIAISGTGVSKKAIYKIGCYVFKKTEKINGQDVETFGVKNFNPNVEKNIVMPATMSACIMYSPTTSPSDVFVFEKISGDTGSTFRYHIYRLV